MFDYPLSFLLTFRDTVGAHPVFALGILLAGSWLLGRTAERIGVPSVTGFIVAGMLLGPRVSGMVHSDLYVRMETVTQIALSMIAVVIGSEFNLARMKRIRRAMAAITVMQLSVTFLLVSVALFASGLIPLPVALLLGAIATSTSPTSTVTIARDLKARGSFIDHLYGAIPLDDAGCLLLFALVAAFSGGFLMPVDSSVPQSILFFLKEAAGSLVLGLATGAAIRKSAAVAQGSNSVYIVSLGLICLMTALASSFELSPLLSGMAAGAVIANSPGKGRNVIDSLDRLSPPLYAVFFAIAGSELDFAVFGQGSVLVLGIVYILTRAAGKYGGVWLGAVLSRSGRNVRNYLGLAMMPHSGVTIGLLLYVQAQSIHPGAAGFPPLMVNIVLMAVFVNELAGPLLSRYAILRGSKPAPAGQAGS
ncbi:MAG: cation:proton antiporter [Candidatus Fermentibacteraceae bacterium]